MQRLSPSIRIGVIRGGPSHEYEDSLLSGAEALKNLREDKVVNDIFITRDGKWHINGIERSPERILKNVDVLLNSLHGDYGEDGQIQRLLNDHGVRHTSSDKYASAMAMNRWIAKERASLEGVRTPVSMLVRRTDKLAKKAKEVFDSIPHPLMVKPASGGSNIISYKVDSFADLLTALENILFFTDSAVVEEYISGKYASCAVIDNFRGKNIYTLPPAEIVSLDDVKCPGNFTEKEKKEIEKVAELIHSKLGLKNYSSSDFVVTPKRGVYLLEVNTTPRLHEKSFLPKSLESVGVEVKEFLNHLLHLAVHKSGIIP